VVGRRLVDVDTGEVLPSARLDALERAERDRRHANYRAGAAAARAALLAARPGHGSSRTTVNP
jgi:hypothetical protein